MNFRFKALIQTLFGLFPNSESLNYFAQKHITKNLPLSKEAFDAKYNQAISHHEVFLKYGETKNAVIYEIGCGWHLATALSLCSFGCYEKIIALDIVNHVRKELVDININHLETRQGDGSSVTSAQGDGSSVLKEWDEIIDISAPCDARKTGLPDESIDFIYSQEVFEHISPALLPDIMAESYRILKPGGIVSLAIHYNDHYCSIDKNISPYNFLRYSEKQWKKYNPQLHYVNRLRHSDFIRIFKSAGFKILEEHPSRPGNWEEQIKNFPFAKEFTDKYTQDELSILSANIVLQKT
ncbi:MAG: class I SAM-dependent methyltransferase [Oscillospiraceae bacterium]|nr:class I SAM-dependent methyltransferase [Oscillospiraceae bacterium]